MDMNMNKSKSKSKSTSPEKSTLDGNDLHDRPDQVNNSSENENVEVKNETASQVTPTGPSSLSPKSLKPNPREGGKSKEDRSDHDKKGGVSSPKAETSTSKKRGRKDFAPSESSSDHKPKRSGVVNVGAEVPVVCFECGKSYSSWKALFGHLRTHPDRGYRGAFPPPSKEWDLRLEAVRRQVEAQRAALPNQQQEEIASTLLSVAKKVSIKLGVSDHIPNQGEIGSFSSSRRGIDIDLNDPIEAESPTKKGALSFDLNMPPILESDDERTESD